MTKEPKETLATKNFKTACDDLAKAFCGQLGVDYDDSWWAADIHGDVFCFLGGEMFTNTTDMTMAIEHGLTWREWCGWYEYWTSQQGQINLRSWIMGARPRTEANG